MNTTALVLLLAGAALLFVVTLMDSGWNLLGFIGITFVLLGIIVEWVLPKVGHE